MPWYKLLNNHIAKQPVPENNAEFLRYIGDVTHALKRMKRYFSNSGKYKTYILFMFVV